MPTDYDNNVTGMVRHVPLDLNDLNIPILEPRTNRNCTDTEDRPLARVLVAKDSLTPRKESH